MLYNVHACMHKIQHLLWRMHSEVWTHNYTNTCTLLCIQIHTHKPTLSVLCCSWRLSILSWRRAHSESWRCSHIWANRKSIINHWMLHVSEITQGGQHVHVYTPFASATCAHSPSPPPSLPCPSLLSHWQMSIPAERRQPKYSDYISVSLYIYITY